MTLIALVHLECITKERVGASNKCKEVSCTGKDRLKKGFFITEQVQCEKERVITSR